MATSDKPLYKNVTVSSPSDQSPVNSKQYRGTSTVDPNSGSFKLYDINLIKQDIVNHFHIRQGEKLENPTFGTIIWDILFEPLTDSLRDAIIQNVTDIVNFDPRVTVDSVVVDTFESGIQIDCSLTYLPYNISETMRLRFDQSSGLI
jgi:phage baseplate assembly protein W